MSWQKDQNWEKDWHGNCVNSFWEETKQTVYAKKMGLTAEFNAGKYPVYDLKGKSVIDIGGGPYSMLLKTINGNDLTVVDPCDYPSWVFNRYTECGVKFIKKPAEKFSAKQVFDEVWIYNCLQHTIDPEKIIQNMKSYSKIIRVFEWIDEPVSVGHPQLLTEEKLNKWFGGFGKVEVLDESGCRGKSYSGIFKGNG